MLEILEWVAAQSEKTGFIFLFEPADLAAGKDCSRRARQDRNTAALRSSATIPPALCASAMADNNAHTQLIIPDGIYEETFGRNK